METSDRFSLEAERSILGECLKSKECFEKLLNLGVVSEDFYNTNHQKIYNALLNTYSKNDSTDVVLVARENKDISIGDLSQLLAESAPIDLKAHVKILMDLSVNRQYLNLAKEIQKGTHENIGDYIKKESEKISLLKSRIESDNTIITMNRIKPVDIYKAEKIKTGFKDIDKRILGFITGSLVVITGYNGNGKSTLINQMCIAESLSQGYKVFAYSPELTNSNLKSWLYPTIAIPEHFITKNYYGEEYKTIGNIGIKAIDEWINDKLYVYSDDSITNNDKQLLRDMEYMVKSKDVRVFIIDNLMKIDLDGSYKNELVAQKQFVNRLKEFARKYNVLVHLVAHPKKPNKDNPNKITKFDVAGSGDITNLADYVLSVTRVTNEMREAAKLKNVVLKDSIVKVMKDRPKGTSEFGIDLSFNSVRKRFYYYQDELNKDYGYTKEITQVECETIPFA